MQIRRYGRDRDQRVIVRKEGERVEDREALGTMS